MHAHLLAKYSQAFCVAGVEMEKFPYVDVIDCTAVQITPIGAESSWSVDGELLHNNSLSGEVHRGLLDVFARGLVA